ncbi:SLAP domain-containing protein [Lactobacillus sp. PSON]|uniref:SLAP domain-containing protein n=1 Tax=Lactobacillus sp. PSON TaxID=3455454 RepID=UPI00404173AD
MKLSRKLVMVSAAALMSVSPLAAPVVNSTVAQAATKKSSNTVHKTYGKNSKVTVTKGQNFVNENGKKTSKKAPKGGEYIIWDVKEFDGEVYYSIQTDLKYWIPAVNTKGSVQYKTGSTTVTLKTDGKKVVQTESSAKKTTKKSDSKKETAKKSTKETSKKTAKSDKKEAKTTKKSESKADSKKESAKKSTKETSKKTAKSDKKEAKTTKKSESKSDSKKETAKKSTKETSKKTAKSDKKETKATKKSESKADSKKESAKKSAKETSKKTAKSDKKETKATKKSESKATSKKSTKKAIKPVKITATKKTPVVDKNGKKVKTYMGSKKYTIIGKGITVNGLGTKKIDGKTYYALQPDHYYVLASDFKTAK